MNSGAMGRFSGFAVVAVTLGGAGMLLGSGSYARVSAPARSVPLVAAKECESFFDAGDRDKDLTKKGLGQDGGVLLWLFRNKNHKTLPKKGAWVGALENKSTMLPSPTFSALKPHDKGCIYFRFSDPLPGQTDPIPEAWFYHYQGGNPTKLFALYCDHGLEGNEDAIPYWGPLPDKACNYFLATINGVSVKITPEAGKKLTEETVKAQLNTQFLAAGMSPKEIAELLKDAGNSGPWFPCSDGCCRATTE